ncbi:MAG: DCL family protein [Cyanobacteria bacterium SZAS-4]|nr:DCL family protein [Cyanobacteria bacterium SZAS-4]
MARHQIKLPSKTFEMKQEATVFFRAMLHRYKDGDEINAADSELLYELLQRHPEAEEKIGWSGVKRFYRDRSPIQPTSGFHIERIDGSKTDFSFNTCIAGKAASLEQEFYQACRHSVNSVLASQKAALFHKAGGVMKCEKTGKDVTIDEAEYRHTSPRFKEIVANFIKDKEIALSDVTLSKSGDMQYSTVLGDPGLEAEFKRYHEKHAKLAVFKKYER